MIALLLSRGLRERVVGVVDDLFSYFEPIRVDSKHQKITRVYFSQTKPKNGWYSNRPISEGSGGWLDRQRKGLAAWWGKWWGDRVTDIALWTLDGLIVGVFLFGIQMGITAITITWSFSWGLTMIKLAELNPSGNDALWDTVELLGVFNSLGLFFILIWFNFRVIADCRNFLKWLNEDTK